MKIFFNQKRLDHYVLRRFIEISDNPKELKGKIFDLESKLYDVTSKDIILDQRVIDVKKGRRRFNLLVLRTKKGTIKFNLGRYYETVPQSEEI